MKARSYAVAAMALAMSCAPARSEPYLGEIQTFASNFCPRGYLAANGQILPIAQNTALFSLLGNAYGGNGVSTFALPTLKPIFTTTGAPLQQCIAITGLYPPRD
ncbi:phage tail protein [Microbaculum marinum]|uniref:Tail fiber protein n=1 Tax=Microbaculum marinum TaxID=1764581 RepID=A0AAW9RR74_9HYPH